MFPTRSAILAGVFACAPVSTALAANAPIGFFTAVQGRVVVTHPPAQTPLAVNLNDNVLFHDLIETRQASRTRARCSMTIRF